MKIILNAVELTVLYRDDIITYMLTCENDVDIIYNNANVSQCILEYINDHEPTNKITLGSDVGIYNYDLRGGAIICQ